MPDKITVEALFDAGKRFLGAAKRFNVPESEYRYYSYNICREHFDNWVSLDEEQDSMILFTYLASWGMIRGSSDLLLKSPYGLKNTVKFLHSEIKSCKGLNLFSCSFEENKETICEVSDGLKVALKADKLENPSITLISKILLGVWGICPAIDTYVRKTFGIGYKNKETIGESIGEALNKIKARLSCDVLLLSENSINFAFKGQPFISKAKLIDMYGFQCGIESSEPKGKDAKEKEERKKELKRRGTVDENF